MHGQQNIENWLRLSMETVAVYCERAIEHIDTNCVFMLQQFVYRTVCTEMVT